LKPEAIISYTKKVCSLLVYPVFVCVCVLFSQFGRVYCRTVWVCRALWIIKIVTYKW